MDNLRLAGAGESKSFDVTVLGLSGGTYCNQVSASSAQYGLSGNDRPAPNGAATQRC